MSETLSLSPLGHTWILDLDGTIVKHNGYLIDGYDTFLPGAVDFLLSIPEGDTIIFLTSRAKEHANMTEQFLSLGKVHFDHIIYGVPFGERVLINDSKPSGLVCALAETVTRDAPCFPTISIDTQK